MWELYDALIEGIPEDCIMEELVCGNGKVWVRSNMGYGFSSLLSGRTRPAFMMYKEPGMKLRHLAACIKSWNMEEASVGQAAMNAYYNSSSVALANGIPITPGRFGEDRMYDPFIAYQNAIRGKKVVSVGHFHYLEQLFQPVCDLSILEFEPRDGDYPLAAADYLLPESDYVILTSAALINKTMPRLLNLCRQATVIAVGPSFNVFNDA